MRAIINAMLKAIDRISMRSVSLPVALKRHQRYQLSGLLIHFIATVFILK
jgi:hypothetical protein